MRILIVEDNATFAALVAEHLQRGGFDSDRVDSIEAASRAISTMSYAAIVLDLGLRDGDGIDLLRGLRERGDSTPIVVASARYGLDDRVRGLREGADDYIAKPFSVDELIARLRAVLRRPGKLLGKVIRAGNVALDTTSRQVNVDGRVHPMALRMTALLELLIRHVGTVVRRRYFEDQLFGAAAEFDSSTVDVYIHRLRRQLEAAGATVVIHTIRGVGYMMTEIEQPCADSKGARNNDLKSGRTS
jgi:DNA-binding response OmpR family regulator